jgi:Putative peptidoglycan binding domain
MKTLLLSITALAVATAPVFGEDQNDHKKQKQNSAQTRQRAVNQVPRSYTPKVQQQLSARTQALQNQKNFNKQTYTPRPYTPPPQNPARVVKPPQPPNSTVNGNNNVPNENKWRNHDNNNNWDRNRPRTDVVTNQTNTNDRNHNWQNDRNRNRNWNNNNNTSTFTFEQARRHHRHDRHDRSWWRSHYSRIALFAGGYYFWNDGYWYPAYGYDPYYSSYTYDEPIYGYNDLAPGDVITNVQTALQEQGYYRDAVDGLIGPRTRAAISDFQRDRGLPITAAIDGPTLQALGLD